MRHVRNWTVLWVSTLALVGCDSGSVGDTDAGAGALDEMGGAGAARLTNLTFETDRLTASARRLTVPGVLTSDATPHASWCDE